MDTTIILGLTALAGILVGGAKAIKKKYPGKHRKKSSAQPTAKTPPKPAQLEKAAPTTAEVEPELAPLEETAPTTAEMEPELAPLEETVESPPVPEIVESIFINHSGTNQKVVDSLVRNLDKTGYRINSYGWESSKKPTSDNTQLKENQAVLVVTPEAIESGWVREQYELMLKRQQNDPDFSFIPVVFNEASSDSAFLPEIEVINFSAENYHEAFHRLVSFLGDKSFDDKDLEIPRPVAAPTMAVTESTREFIQAQLNHFDKNSPPPLMLLAQSDRWQAPLIDALLSEARTRYQPERCLHIALPYSIKADTPEYFAILAQQCELSDSVCNGIEFEQALLERLKNQSHPLLLLISRFEHGAQSTQQQLAGMMRSLNESHANQLHIILGGGEKLAELKYIYGSHSLLNIAQESHWPELERADVYALRDNCCPDLAMDDEDADHLLAESGGHPNLLQKCVQLYQNEPTLRWQDYSATLSLDPLAWQIFTPFVQNRKHLQQLHEWLAQEQVAPVSTLYSYGDKRNELLRRLYWKNLLVLRPNEGQKYLCWRSEALRSVGQSLIRYQLSIR
jgi:hypothetical protein